VKNGRERVKAKTGRVFRLGKQPPAATQPTKVKRDDEEQHSPL
jgi:hypothetical protein